MLMIDLNEFTKTVMRIREKALEDDRLLNNPSDDLLLPILENEAGITKTIYGSYVAESDPTSRAAIFTKNSVDNPFGEEELQLLAQCEESLSKERIISIDRIVGDNNSKTIVRLIVPQRFAHVAYGGKNLFLPVKKEIKED